MGCALTTHTLHVDNQCFAGTGGISRHNRSQGLRPAFYDAASGQTVMSCYADGRPAPVHLLDGIPAEWVTVRDAGGRVLAVKASVVAGFIRGGHFYTRAQAAGLVECDCQAYQAAGSCAPSRST